QPLAASGATVLAAVPCSGPTTLSQTISLGRQPLSLTVPRPHPPGGGADEKSLVDATVPGLLTVEVLHASTVAEGNHSRSEASVARLSLTTGGNTISAGFLMARAEARCTTGGATTSGSSEIADL